MPRLGLGLGLNLPKPFYIGVTPQPLFPSGFSEYWNAYDESLINTVTGVSIDAWTGTSVVPQILAQATSANQPTLIEYDLATQYVTSSQPRLIDTGGGVLAVNFDFYTVFDIFLNINTSSVDFATEIKLAPTVSTGQLYIYSKSDSGSYFRITNSTTYQIRTLEAVTYDFTSNGNTYDEHTLKLIKTGSSIELIEDGVSLGVVDISTNTFYFDRLSNPVAPLKSNVFYFKQWNSADSSGTPDFELLPTIETIPSGIGNPMPKWYATSHNQFQNRIRKANDEYMDDYPIQTGDQSHVIRSSYDVLATLKKDLSHSTLPSYVGVNASNQFVLTSDLGTVFTFATTTIDTENRAKVWVVRGNDLEFWLDAVLVETKDFTGETLTLDQYGAPTDSSTGDTEYLVPYPSALSQSDIEYFNYLRDDLTNEIILVNGEPVIVS